MTDIAPDQLSHELSDGLIDTRRPAVAWTLGRLEELRRELAAGHSQLVELGRRQADLRDSMLQVEGAIRILEEQVAADPSFGPRPGPES